MDEESYDASNPDHIEKATKKTRRKKDESLDVIQMLMNAPAGRAWLWDLIEGTDPHGWPIVTGDTHLTYAMIGQKNVGHKILQDCLNFPDLYLKMAAENRKK